MEEENGVGTDGRREWGWVGGGERWWESVGWVGKRVGIDEIDEGKGSKWVVGDREKGFGVGWIGGNGWRKGGGKKARSRTQGMSCKRTKGEEYKASRDQGTRVGTKGDRNGKDGREKLRRQFSHQQRTPCLKIL